MGCDEQTFGSHSSRKGFEISLRSVFPASMAYLGWCKSCQSKTWCGKSGLRLLLIRTLRLGPGLFMVWNKTNQPQDFCNRKYVFLAWFQIYKCMCVLCQFVSINKCVPVMSQYKPQIFHVQVVSFLFTLYLLVNIYQMWLTCMVLMLIMVIISYPISALALFRSKTSEALKCWINLWWSLTLFTPVFTYCNSHNQLFPVHCYCSSVTQNCFYQPYS